MQKIKYNIQQFLDTLDEYELANFYFYKYDTFMEYSQKIIDEYFINKNISYDKIKKLTEESQQLSQSDNKNHCPRCYSIKKVKTQELWHGTISYSGALLTYATGERRMIDIEDCLICGYQFSNLNRSSKNKCWFRRFFTKNPLHFKKKVLPLPNVL